MKLEDQVCSLELAKRLKELGVNSAHCFWWIKTTGAGGSRPNPHVGRIVDKESERNSICPAFTVAELGEMLPRGYSSGEIKEIDPETYWCESGNVREWDGYTEANARAKMLIHLIEKGMVKP